MNLYLISSYLIAFILLFFSTFFAFYRYKKAIKTVKNMVDKQNENNS